MFSLLEGHDPEVIMLIGGTFFFTAVALIFVFAMSFWNIFEKAGRKGYEGIVPLYNIVVLFKIADVPFWLLIFFILPIVNYVAAIPLLLYASIKLSKKFGKEKKFFLLMIFFPFIAYPMLAFSDAMYEKQKKEEKSVKKPEKEEEKGQ